MNKNMLALIVAAGLCSCASAQPAPGGGGPPPGGLDDGPRPGDRRPMMEGGWREQRGEISVPFLGVETSPLDPATRSQIKIAGKSGLQVNFVSDDSPAKTAGIQQYDVIAKLDDQVLFNPPQLMSLIHSRKAGDEVKLIIIRQGEQKTISVKLAERKMPAGHGGLMMGGMPPSGMPPMGMPPMGMGGPGMRPPGAAVRSLTIGDDAMRVEVKSVDGKVELTATGKDGAAIFTGPIDTPEDRAKLPDPVKQRLSELAMDHLVKMLRQASPHRMGGGMGPPGWMGPGDPQPMAPGGMPPGAPGAQPGRPMPGPGPGELDGPRPDGGPMPPHGPDPGPDGQGGGAI